MSSIRAKPQRKKPWIPPPGKSTTIPPLERPKDLWPLQSPKTYRGMVYGKGIKNPQGHSYSARGHGFTSSTVWPIENICSLRPAYGARDAIEEKDMDYIKENLHTVIAELEQSSERLKDVISELGDEMKKDDANQLKCKLPSIECNLQKKTIGKKSSSARKSTIYISEGKKVETRKTAKEMGFAILKAKEKRQKMKDLEEEKSMGITDIKLAGEIKKQVDAAVTPTTRKTKDGMERSSVNISKKMQRDLEVLEPTREQNLIDEETDLNQMDIEFYRELKNAFHQLQDITGEASGSGHTLSGVLRYSTRPGSSMNETVKLLRGSKSDTAKSLKKIFELFFKKNREIYLLKKHCVNLHEVADEAEVKEDDKKVLKTVASKMADFPKNLHKGIEELEAEIRCKSEKLHRLSEAVETFKERLKSYSPDLDAAARKDATEETISTEITSEEDSVEEEAIDNTQKTAVNKEDDRHSKEQKIIVTLNETDPEFERRIMARIKEEIGPGVRFTLENSLSHTGSKNLNGNEKRKSREKESSKFKTISEDLSDTTVSKPSYEAKFPNSMTDSTLEEFYKYNTEESSELKSRGVRKHFDEPSHVRNQRGEKNVCFAEDTLIDMDMPQGSGLAESEENGVRRKQKEMFLRRLAAKTSDNIFASQPRNYWKN